MTGMTEQYSAEQHSREHEYPHVAGAVGEENETSAATPDAGAAVAVNDVSAVNAATSGTTHNTDDRHHAPFALHNTIYRDGTATPMILVHAFPVDHHMWDACAAQIITRADARGLDAFALWAPDMPGAGEGPIPAVQDNGHVAADGAYTDALDLMTDAYASLLKHAGYQRAVWVGLSMGGYVVMDMQRRHPELIAGLAMCDTKASADGTAARANRLRIADECERDHTIEPVMHFAEPQDGDSSIKRSDAFIKQMTAWIQAQSPEGIAWRQRMAAGRPDLNDQLAAVQTPTAVISGECDPSSPPEQMRALAEAMTGTEVSFTQIPDCGHFSAVEHPDIVADALVDLMARVQRPERSGQAGHGEHSEISEYNETNRHSETSERNGHDARIEDNQQ